jgi:hypothetical protein
MTEYAGIFDYQLSEMVFGILTIGFMAAYGLAAIWIVARSKDRVLGPLQTA